jgi:predicted nucleotidyltransferase
VDVSPDHIQQIESIAGDHQLSLVLLFGSAVTGQGEHQGSDLDIAVRYSGKVPAFNEQYQLIQQLQGLFPDREVDLAVINHADPLFLKKITENCRLLHGDPGQLQELKIYAFKRYQDHRPYFLMERAFVDRFVQGADAPSSD